jgi:NADH-quinone oxidoreductase subunit N
MILHNFYPTLLTALTPDLIVLIALFAALGVDYGLLRTKSLLHRSRTAAGIATGGLVLGALAVIWQIYCVIPLSLGQDQIVLNALTLGAKALIFILAAIVCVLSAEEAPNAHVSEYFALILLSTLGAGFLATTENLLLLFISLELMSLSLYALTAFKKDSRDSAEAALKYFTFGAVSSAFLLFGLSYLYGVVQTLNLHDAAVVISSMTSVPPLLRAAYLFILVGLGFKIAMVPFHFWAPDVYQSAPAPIAGWIASGSKIASFFILLKILQPVSATPETLAIWGGAFALGSVLSLVVGNLGALRQTNLKRLLAYSSIGHAGYMLVGVLGASVDGMAAVLFYVAIYAAANLGAFGVINLVCDRAGKSAEIGNLAGLWKREPFLAVVAAIFFLSLAGIPPLAGFIGKFYLFFAAIGAHPHIDHWYEGYYWLVGTALLFCAVSLYYYLLVLKACFVADPASGEESAQTAAKPIRIVTTERICLILLAVFVLASGMFPGPLFQMIRSALAP